MKIFNHATGSLGETLAAKHLEKLNYQIIDKNFQTRFGEIDLIVLTPDKQTLIFVEVKTKTGNLFGSPEDMVNQHKLKQVYRTSQIFLQHNNIYNNISSRIDIIAIVLTPDKQIQTLNHYPAVY